MSKPLCIDLYCGLGGWAEGFLAEGYHCRGYDIEAHEYWVPDVNGTADGSKGTRPVEKRGWTQGCAVSLGLEGKTAQRCTKLLKYPSELILRDVRSITGAECKDAAVIVASPPCQAYSYRAMPWKRAKALPPPDNTLFNECFRIQREASEAAGHYIPLIVENVRGAQKWVGRAQWNYGSFFLWGDVPALMPMTLRIAKAPGHSLNKGEATWRPANALGFERPEPNLREGLKVNPDGTAHPSGSWFKIADSKNRGARSFQSCAVEETGVKQGGDWFGANCESSMSRLYGSKSPKRKAASAMIAKIPFPLANYLARHFKQAQP